MYNLDLLCNTIHTHTAWMGHFCETDVDGCDEISCYEGVACIDVPAPGEGAMCGPCPVGFTGDGQKCLGRLSKQRCIRLESNQSCKTKCELDLGSINISYLNLQISVFFFSFAHRKEIDDH